MTRLMLHGVVAVDAPHPPAAAPHLRLAAGKLLAVCTLLPPSGHHCPDDSATAFGAVATLPGVADVPAGHNPFADPAAAAAAALAHHALLCAYCADCDVVPVRFGSVFSAPSALGAHVAASGRAFLHQLDRLRGLREYSVTLTTAHAPAPIAAPTPAPTGRDFLKLRRGQRDQRQGQGTMRAAFVDAVAVRLAAFGRVEPVLRRVPGRVADLALLVAVPQVAALTRCAATLHAEARAQGLDLQMTGPWPAYSFSGEPALERTDA